MAIVCKVCGKEYDISLFQFGKKIKCECGNIVELKGKVLNKISKEAEDKILEMLNEAEDFYLPVKKIYKELNNAGYPLPEYKDFLNCLKKDKRFEWAEFEEKEDKELEELGYYSGPRIKLKARKITKEDMERIVLKHAQNVIDNLVKAYEHRPEDLSSEEEDRLIELMIRAKKLKEEIIKIFKK